VLPLAFAFGLHGLADPQFALFAAFGSFSTLAMADFVGPHRSRFVAYLVLMLLGSVMIVIGTALSNTLWQAVVAMAVIGAALQFSAALGGQFALGNNTAILMFVLAVMVPAGSDAVPGRLGGWIVACACAAMATALLWPRHERRDLYLRLVEAVRALAAIARTAATGDRPGRYVDDAKAAIDRAIAAHGMLGFRPIGPINHQRALLGLFDDLSQGWRFAAAMPAGPRMSDDDRGLAVAIATTLDAVADVLEGCVDGRPGVPPDLQALTNVQQAFAVAPVASLVGGPLTGIRMHFQVDSMSWPSSRNVGAPGTAGSLASSARARTRIMSAYRTRSSDATTAAMVCPPSRFVTVGAVPLKGTYVSRTPACWARRRATKWKPVYVPEPPTVTVSGRARAAPSRSSRVRCGLSFSTTRARGVRWKSAIGTRSSVA